MTEQPRIELPEHLHPEEEVEVLRALLSYAITRIEELENLLGIRRDEA